MDNLVLTRRKPQDGPMKAFLTHREFHGYSSPDYSTVARLDAELALDLGKRGLVMWAEDFNNRTNGPAVLFTKSNDNELEAIVSVRADASDPSTEAVSFKMDMMTARAIVERGQAYQLSWLYGAPAAEDFGIAA